MDKYDIIEKNNARKAFRYRVNPLHLKNPIGKLSEAFKFKKFAIRIIEKENYDFLIIWREYAVFLFSNYVYKKYRGKYSVNIRDLWNEKNLVMTYYIKKATKRSCFNTVCSDGFIPYLPKADYWFLHCLNYETIKKIPQVCRKKKTEGPIVIAYIGTLRFLDYCCKVVDVFGNDERFLIKFIGQGSEQIEKYSSERKLKNVLCKGAFAPENTASFLEDVDILNCAYGAKSKAEMALLPTRFYYAVYMGIPVLTSEGTWLEEKANGIKNGIVIPSEISNTSGVSDDVYNSYMAMDFDKMHLECQKYTKEIEETTDRFEKKLIEIVK